MSWLTEFVRPKIRTLLGRREVPENLWVQCPSCQQMMFHTEHEKNLRVCSHCGHHLRMPADKRLDCTFDTDTYTRIELPKVPPDPLRVLHALDIVAELGAGRPRKCAGSCQQE